MTSVGGSDVLATGFRPAAVSVRAARRSAGNRRRARGRCRRPVDRHADGSTTARGGRRVLAFGCRAGVSRQPRHARAAAGGEPLDRSTLRRGRRPASRSPPASAPRSSSARCRNGYGCAAPTATPILYPAISYPTYEMGAILAGCRAVPSSARRGGSAGASPRSLRRTPGVPSRCGSTVPATRPVRSTTSARPPRGAAPTACRCSPTSATSSSPGPVPARSILQHGTDGVIALHSLSKRSNLAGGRIGFYAGDADLVRYLQEVRKHVGMMVPGPVPGGRCRGPRRRRARRGAAPALCVAPDAGWPPFSARGRGSRSARRPAGSTCGSPSATRGPGPSASLARAVPSSALASSTDPWPADHVRVAVVQPDDRIELVAQRLGV